MSDYNYTNLALAVKTVDLAREDLGQKEATGRNDGSYVRKIQNWLGAFMENQPWCAAFATYKLYQAAKQLGMKPVLSKSGSSTSIYAEARKKGLLLMGPKPYCIGLLRGNGGSPGKTHHHTFLVGGEGAVEADKVWSIDGNYKNAVSRTQHLIKDCDFVELC